MNGNSATMPYPGPLHYLQQPQCLVPGAVGFQQPPHCMFMAVCPTLCQQQSATIPRTTVLSWLVARVWNFVPYRNIWIWNALIYWLALWAAIGHNIIAQFLCSLLYTMSQKNDNDVTHYNLNTHQSIWVIFSRDVAVRVCYQMVICFPTSPN